MVSNTHHIARGEHNIDSIKTSFWDSFQRLKIHFPFITLQSVGRGLPSQTSLGLLLVFFKLVYQRRAHVKTTCQLTVAAVLLAIA